MEGGSASGIVSVGCSSLSVTKNTIVQLQSGDGGDSEGASEGGMYGKVVPKASSQECDLALDSMFKGDLHILTPHILIPPVDRRTIHALPCFL